MAYKPLDTERKQIRLLHLPACSQLEESADDANLTIDIERSTEAPGLQCTFSLVCLDEDSTYEALSYAWGDQSCRTRIELDGSLVTIATSLYTALQNLRLKNVERIIWVDALCIDQSDTSERTHQVTFMGDIYRRASCVIVWLGEEWPGCDAAIEFLIRSAENKDAHLDVPLESRAFPEGLSLDSKDLRRHLFEFFDKPWWKRLWTVQEYILARNVIFQCGQQNLSENSFAKGVERMMEHKLTCCVASTAILIERDDETGAALNEVIWKIINLSAMKASSSHESFLTIMAAFRSRQCSDPRDRVFGFLGLANGIYEALIEPDYSFSVQEVYIAATLALIRRSRNLDVFTQLYSDGTLKNLPSWVPDWATLIDTDTLTAFLVREHILPLHSAAGDRGADLTCSMEKAVTTGVSFDTIMNIGIAWNECSRLIELHDEWYEFVQNCALPDMSYCRTGVINETAFWMTLCGGMIWDALLGIQHVDITIDVAKYCKWRAWLATYTGFAEDPVLYDDDIRSFHHTFVAAIPGRRFFITKTGRFGLGRDDITVGDRVCILAGGRVPYILRPLPGPARNHRRGSMRAQEYKILGDAYVQGIMKGEIVEMMENDTELNESGLQWTKIVLV